MQDSQTGDLSFVVGFRAKAIWLMFEKDCGSVDIC